MARKPTSDERDWVELKGESAAKTMVALAKQYYDDDTRRRAYYRIAVEGMKDQIGVRNSRINHDELDLKDLGGPILRRVERALIARIMRSKPKPTIVTSDGSYDMRQRAKKLDRLIEGEWARMKAYEALAMQLRWSLRLGTGILHVTDAEHVGVRVVRPWNVVVDPAESAEGDPKRWYMRTICGKRATAKKYGVEASKLEASDGKDDIFGTNVRASRTDECEVWTAWYCDPDDGRVVVGSGGTLLDESPWPYDHPPLVCLNWETPMNGVWGDGLGVELAGHQYELDAVRRTMRAQLRNAVGFWWIPAGCEATEEQMDDRPGKVMKGGTAPPQWVSPEAHTQSLVTWLDRIESDAFQAAGISQMAASAEKPAGLTAATALQHWSDLDDLRNLPQAEAFEAAVLGLGELTIEAAKRIYEDSGNYDATIYDTGKSFGETIAWKDVDMDRDVYSLRMFPTSSLPSHPAARQQVVAEWFNGGIIDRRQYMDLLGMPDVLRVMSLTSSPYDIAAKLIDQILVDGEMVTTVPELGDQKIVLKLAQQSLLRALADGMPETDKRIAMLRGFIEQCITWGQRSVDATQAVQAHATPATPPMGAPMPPEGMPQ